MNQPLPRLSVPRLAAAVLAVAACSAPRAGRAEPVKPKVAPPAAPVSTGAQVGQPAPDFLLFDTDGNSVSLKALHGKTVVLEWFNPECPFVRYAHGEGPLADMGVRETAKGIVWLAVNSSAPGRQGNGRAKNQEARARWKMTYPLLIDEDGKVGQAYGAKSTPHMFVIDGKGKLVYKGALDNAPLGRVSGKQVNYVAAALAALAAGKAISPAETQSYGCSVKYAGR